MTITLNPKTEALLYTVATQRGLSPEETINALLGEAEINLQEMMATLPASVDEFNLWSLNDD